MGQGASAGLTAGEDQADQAAALDTPTDDGKGGLRQHVQLGVVLKFQRLQLLCTPSGANPYISHSTEAGLPDCRQEHAHGQIYTGKRCTVAQLRQGTCCLPAWHSTLPVIPTRRFLG